MNKSCRTCKHLTLNSHESSCAKDVNIFDGGMNFIPTEEIDKFYCAYHEPNVRVFEYIGGGNKPPTCAKCGSSITLMGPLGTYCNNKDCITNKE